MRRSIIIVAFILKCIHTLAQSFTVYNYSVPEGLPSSEVYEVFQDRNGFLWFATDNGVVKFDGSQMETFHIKDGLSDPVVFGFYEDYRGRLWFRSFSGKLSYYENGKIKRYQFNEQIAKINYIGFVNFIVNEKDELWFTVRNILGKIDSNGILTSTAIKEPALYCKTVNRSFLIGCSNNNEPITAIIIDNKSFPIKLSEMAYQSRVTCALKWKGNSFFSLNRDVFQFDGKSVIKVLTGDNAIISLSSDKEDKLWVGYLNGGVERFTDTSFKNPWRPNFLKNKSITKVHQDHEDGFWFTSLENGVFHVPNLLIEHFTMQSQARIKAVLSTSDFVLVGDQAGNLVGLDNSSKKKLWIKHLDPPILSLFANQNGKIWISTSSQIRLFGRNLKLEKEFPGTANDFSEDSKHVTWAFGGNKIRAFDQNEKLQITTSLDVPYRSIYAEDSLLYMAERTGLHIRNRELKVVDMLKELSDFKISNILQYDDSTLLISTIGNGFLLFDKKNRSFKLFNGQHNFFADNIYSSMINGQNLWLGTEKGLIKIPLANLNKPNLSFEYLTRRSGLLSDKIDFLLNVKNTIWAFSDNAFSIIPENFSKFANKKPLFYIQEIKVNDENIVNDNIIELKYDQDNIQIAFGFISFNNQNIFIRYRLSTNDAWIYTINKKLLFSSLAPGKYNFDIQYSTDNTHWASATPGITFKISQPWWNRWYTYLTSLVIIIVLGYLYFRYQQSIYKQKHHYMKIINEHQQKLLQSEVVTLERERNRISKELHDRVGTNLTAIKMMVNQLLQLYKEPKAKDVEEQFQIAIKEIKDIIYGLAPPSLERYGLYTGLKNYIGKINKTIPIDIALKTFGNEVNNYELNIIVFRVLQELLTNSIKHSYARLITIHINSFDDMINIVYEDDGVGFSYDPLQSGLGLDNIESRIHSVNGTLKFESGNFGISYTIDIPITLNKEVV